MPWWPWSRDSDITTQQKLEFSLAVKEADKSLNKVRGVMREQEVLVKFLKCDESEK